MKLKINKVIYGSIPGALALTSALHWAVPIAIGIVSAASVVILYIPQITIAIFFYGLPLVKAFLFADRVLLSLLILSILGILTIIAIKFHGKIVLPKIDWFQILLFILIVWVLTTLLWTPNYERGIHKWRLWIITCVFPLELIIIMARSNLKLKNIPEYSVYIGIVLLIISYITLRTNTFSPLQRFNVEGSDWNYARSLGFLLLTCVWLFDKSCLWKKILLIGISMISVYFLIKAATRAPFFTALFLAAVYLLFFSKVKLSIKIITVLLLFSAAVYLLSGSYLFLRIVGLKHSIELSSSIRLTIFEYATRNLSKIPPWGIGAGGFHIFLPQLLKYILHPHNSLLEMFIETGIIGFSIYIILMIIFPIYVAVRYLINIYNHTVSRNPLLEYALLIWLFGFTNDLINDALASGRYEWISLGFLYSIIFVNKNNEQKRKNEQS